MNAETVRGDGVHWRAGPAPNGDDGILDTIWWVLDPAAPTIMNEPEARWHWANVASRRTGLTIWRASPQDKPAQSGWDGHVYSRSIFRSLDEHAERTGRYPTDVCLLNELNLNYERGDNEDDTNTDTWRNLYSYLSRFLEELLIACQERAKARNAEIRWWAPGWSPGHGEQALVSIWAPVWRRFHGVVMHAYRDRDGIAEMVLWYLKMFPTQQIVLGEWNMDGFSGDWVSEEARTRARLRILAAHFPRFFATYFIWAWSQDNQRRTYDIESNPTRLKIWQPSASLPRDIWVPPWSEKGAAGPGSGTGGTPPETGTLEACRAEVARLNTMLASANNLVGNAYAANGEVYKALQRIVDQRDIHGKRLTKSQMSDQARAIQGFLAANRPAS